MKSKLSTIGLVVLGFSFLSLAGCKKKEEAPAATTDAAAAPAPPPEAPPPEAAAPTGDAPPAPGDVKRYPNETPVGHVTVRAVVPFTVYQEADLVSQKLGAVATGTFVNVMATYSNWILVEWPSGVGELSPGWAPIPNIYDKRLAMATDAEKEKVQKERPANTRRPILKVRPKK